MYVQPSCACIVDHPERRTHARPRSRPAHAGVTRQRRDDTAPSSIVGTRPIGDRARLTARAVAGDHPRAERFAPVDVFSCARDAHGLYADAVALQSGPIPSADTVAVHPIPAGVWSV